MPPAPERRPPRLTGGVFRHTSTAKLAKSVREENEQIDRNLFLLLQRRLSPLAERQRFSRRSPVHALPFKTGTSAASFLSREHGPASFQREGPGQRAGGRDSVLFTVFFC